MRTAVGAFLPSILLSLSGCDSATETGNDWGVGTAGTGTPETSETSDHADTGATSMVESDVAGESGEMGSESSEDTSDSTSMDDAASSEEDVSETSSTVDTGTKDTSTEDTETEDSDSEDTSSDDTSSDDTSSDDTSSDDTSSDDTSSDDTSSDDTSSEDSSTDDETTETGGDHDIPQTIDIDIVHRGKLLTLVLTRYSTRARNFNVWQRDTSGELRLLDTTETRIYVGNVEAPGEASFHLATVVAKAQPDTDLISGVISTHNDVSIEFSAAYSDAILGSPGPAIQGGPGGITVAYDVHPNVQNELDNDIERIIDQIEYYNANVDLVYTRDARTHHLVGDIVLAAASDYPTPDAGGGIDRMSVHHTALGNMWSAHHGHLERDVACLVVGGESLGGLAPVGNLGTNGAYVLSWWAMGASGQDHVLEHEIGHTWGANHCEDPWMDPYIDHGPSMCGNDQPRWLSPTTVAKVTVRRQAIGEHEQGLYPVRVRPYLNSDIFEAMAGVDTRLDVLANDYDANAGDQLRIAEFDGSSAFGATIRRSSGTGPGGRDELIYRSELSSGQDTFTYTVADQSGLQHRLPIRINLSKPDPGAPFLVEQFLGDTEGQHIDGASGGLGFTDAWHCPPEHCGIFRSLRSLGDVFPSNVPLSPRGGHLNCNMSGGSDLSTMERPLAQPIDLATNGEYYLSFVGTAEQLTYWSGGLLGFKTPAGERLRFGWEGRTHHARQPFKLKAPGVERTQADAANHGMNVDSPRFFVVRIRASAAGPDQLDLKVYRSNVDEVHTRPSELTGQGNGDDQWTLSATVDLDLSFNQMELSLDYGQGRPSIDEIRVGRTWFDVTGLR